MLCEAMPCHALRCHAMQAGSRSLVAGPACLLVGLAQASYCTPYMTHTAISEHIYVPYGHLDFSRITSKTVLPTVH